MSPYRSLLALLSSYGILLLANGLFGTVVSLRTKTEAFPDSIIGVVLAGYFAGLLLSSFYAARIVARTGHIRAFAMFASIASTVALTHLLWVNPLLWGILRVISGFCMGGMIVVTEGWLNNRASNENRGSVLALYMVTTYACIGSAQLLLMAGGSEGFKLFVIVSILYSLALVPILMTQSKEPPPAQPHRPNLKKMYNISPVSLMGAFVVGFINGIFYTLTPIFAHHIGLTLEQTAIFIALGVMSGMLLQFPLGKLSDKIDRRWVIVFSCLMTAVACYFLYRADNSSVDKLYGLAILYGSVAFSINPICIAHMNDLTPANERTQTASGMLAMFGVGAVLGPIIAGFLIPYDVDLIYALSGSVVLIFGVYALIRVAIKPRHDQKKDEFHAFSVQSPARQLNFSDDSVNDEKTDTSKSKALSDE